jgi:hypothetical protein
MNNASLLACVLALCCWNCAGQTNSLSAAPRLFSLSAPGLRQPVSESQKSVPASAPTDTEGSLPQVASVNPEKSSSDATVKTNSIAPPDQMVLASRLSDFDFQIVYRLDKAGYLTRPEPPSDNRFDRIMDSTFRPEVFHFRKVDVECSLITAIKRKNPLCLLNPIFFNMTW